MIASTHEPHVSAVAKLRKAGVYVGIISNGDMRFRESLGNLETLARP